MSLYLQRLLETAAPAPTLAGPTAAPPAFLTQSPLFDADQRLDLYPQATLPLAEPTPAKEEMSAPLPDTPERPAPSQTAAPPSDTAAELSERTPQELPAAEPTEPGDRFSPSPEVKPEPPLAQPLPSEQDRPPPSVVEPELPSDPTVPKAQPAPLDPLDSQPPPMQRGLSDEGPEPEPSGPAQIPPKMPAELARPRPGLFDGDRFHFEPEVEETQGPVAEQRAFPVAPGFDAPMRKAPPQQATPAQDLAASPLVHQAPPQTPEPAPPPAAAAEPPRPPREVTSRTEGPALELASPKQPRTAAEASVIGPLRPRRFNARLFRLGRY